MKPDDAISMSITIINQKKKSRKKKSKCFPHTCTMQISNEYGEKVPGIMIFKIMKIFDFVFILFHFSFLGLRKQNIRLNDATKFLCVSTIASPDVWQSCCQLLLGVIHMVGDCYDHEWRAIY